MSTMNSEGSYISLYINIEWRDLYVQLLYEVCLLARLKKTRREKFKGIRISENKKITDRKPQIIHS